MATELQMAVINRYISKAPETLEELQEYVDTCAAINKDRNGDIYWIIGLIIRLLPQPAAPAEPEATDTSKPTKTEEPKTQTGSDDQHVEPTITEPPKTDEPTKPEVIKGIRYFDSSTVGDFDEAHKVAAVYDASFVSVEESPIGTGATQAEAFEALNAEREKRNADAATKAKAGDNAKTE